MMLYKKHDSKMDGDTDWFQSNQCTSFSLDLSALKCPLDIKLGSFTLELDSVLSKIKNRKATGLDEIPPEVWKTRQFNGILLRHCNAVYNQNPIDRWMKGCILPFPKKGRPQISQELPRYNTSIAAKIYNVLLCNYIEPKIENIIRKNQNGFRRNRSMTLQILTIRRILEGIRAKKPTGDNTICQLYQGLWFHSQREDGKNSTSIPKETIAAIMILYRNTKVKVRSLDGERLLRYCSRSTVRGHISPIPLYHLSRLCT